MSGGLQICSYINFKLSRRTKHSIITPLQTIRTDLQPSAPVNGRQKGTITIETALVLPLFLFAVLTFCYLFQVMEFQLKLQAALNQAAEQTASYGYLLGRVAEVTEQKAEEFLEKTELFSKNGLLSLDDAGDKVIKLLYTAPAETVLGHLTAMYMDMEDAGLLRVDGGWEGISFAGSCLRDEERCVVVSARYKIEVPFIPESAAEIEVCQNAVCRLHCGDRDYIPLPGKDDAKETGIVYYVTPSGSVYHLHRDCRYLRIEVLSTQKENLATLRNSSGGKYYPCRRCVKGAEEGDMVFYTKSGSSYHSTRNCSSLTRTVLERTKEEIVGLPPCSICGQAGTER